MLLNTILRSPLLAALLTFPVSSFAQTGERPLPFMELNRALILPTDQATQGIRPWLSYRIFDESLDFLDYAKKTGTTTKLERWSSLRGGVNAPLSKHTTLRLYLEQGQQKLSRPVEPKRLNPDYWGGDIRLQWHTALSPDTHWAAEAGYRLHRSPTASVTKLKQGGLLATAAPGKTLFDSSARDHGWLLSGLVRHRVLAAFTLHASLEYRSILVQTNTSSLDPLIQVLLIRQQVPQTTPWDERHIVAGAGFDWRILDKTTLSMDLRQYVINRENYQPRTGFKDYNRNTQFDAYLSYTPRQSWLLFIHGQATSHFVLGDLPALYNRRNNHIFKNPFGFLSFGVQYAF